MNLVCAKKTALCLSVLLFANVRALTLRAQAANSTVSTSPGGVPVPPVPLQHSTASVTTSSAPLSNVFRVRVVDGRNGLAMDRVHLQLWYDEMGSQGTVLVTNAQGVALLPAPVGMPVRLLIAPQDAIDCARSLKDSTTGAGTYNLATLAANGAVSVNRCGRVGAKSLPGELVLFARPLRWYEGLNR